LFDGDIIEIVGNCAGAHQAVSKPTAHRHTDASASQRHGRLTGNKAPADNDDMVKDHGIVEELEVMRILNGKISTYSST
jgi:hypothetical protein